MLLLEVVQRDAGDEKHADYGALVRALDALSERPPDADCPYRDLRAFREEEQPLFFGRDAFTSELAAALVGASGSGKSSVVQAGLIPVLRARGGWAVGILRPGPEPWRSLAACLLELIEGEPTADERVKRVIATGELAARFADVGDQPLLEFCLTQLYARSRDGTLCQAAFEAIGGVRGAIVQRADSVIDAMESEHPGRAAMARDIFLQLVQLGEGSEDTRRRAPLVDFDDVARALIGELATARLLVTGRDPGSATETVEVAHEALIRNWHRLHQWLQEDRTDLHQRREIGRATLAWRAHGDSYRWPDERVIRETAPMLPRLGSRFELNDAERDFLGPLAADAMLALLDEASTPQALRAQIGDRLALLPRGHPRPGVGVGADGLPEIAWHAIPGGEVELDIDATGLWKRWRGRPRFQVAPFHIARHPLTIAQWRVFLEAADGYDELLRKVYSWLPAFQRGSDNQPAGNVTWIEAMAYCQWLSVTLGFPVRLPTEWEWQQAATGGDPRSEFPWGEWQEGRANTVDSELGRMTAVGLYPQGASAQGVLDLTGNTWDWCLNKFDTPSDATLAVDARRVVRGGSWGGDRHHARCASRLDYAFSSTATTISAFGCCVFPPSRSAEHRSSDLCQLCFADPLEHRAAAFCGRAAPRAYAVG
ncbi:MAG: SUMF1/EgtB/PvdO family nonheme iron enzyme [Candidatus Accumulibacter phosphatis]|uniref:formylglycine-generating enzyme family protein n=1 Tax=Candidatus Accumulibacter sp. ACC012 TaxID=2823332 RepID=UPI0025BFE0FF|nr:SUMF1/EgtB/PvdO family nonheme iron enzyme [Candidatus Accumulibacter sp. ACC012]